jgi:hypothetical protein
MKNIQHHIRENTELPVTFVTKGKIRKNFQVPTIGINGNHKPSFVGWKAEVTFLTPKGHYTETIEHRVKADVVTSLTFLDGCCNREALSITLRDGVYKGGYTTHAQNVHGSGIRPHGLSINPEDYK